MFNEKEFNEWKNEIIDNYSCRIEDEEKSRFREYIQTKLNNEGTLCKIDLFDDDTINNIIIGDIDNAKIVFVAHYDTSMVGLLEYIMTSLGLTVHTHVKGFLLKTAIFCWATSLSFLLVFFEGIYLIFLRILLDTLCYLL